MKMPVRPMSAGESLMPGKSMKAVSSHRGALPSSIELVHLPEERSWLLHELFMEAAVHWNLAVSEVTAVAEQQTTPGGPDLTQDILIESLPEVAARGPRASETALLARVGDEFFGVCALCTHHGGPLSLRAQELPKKGLTPLSLRASGKGGT